MKLNYFAHAAVGLESENGSRLIVDPYEPGALGGALRYEPIDRRFDFVTCTHGHDDHSAVEALPEPRPEPIDEGTHGSFTLHRCSLAHDEYEGERFGGDVEALEIEVDGQRIVHLSDVGHSPVGAGPESLRRPEVALVPTGGMYTIGSAQALEWVRRLSPRVAIPIHYADSACDLPLHSLEAFRAHSRQTRDRGDSTFEVPDQLPDARRTTVVLEPECGAGA